jgi:N6-adenosine-specific RNA methylase IME4
MWEMRELLFDTKIELLMADNCLLGIWITNKPAVRDLVLGDEGLFACWAIELVEEWVWLKTTLHGEPVSPLEALWRKPYEVLLLGRKRPPNRQNAFTEDVKKRVIIAVPDLHSRKPCLKELIEPLMLDPKEYSALEVFARHLVTGWWSWGNENIKFNWTGYWHEEDGNDS